MTGSSLPAELVELGSGWALWRDVAVRSAGFPVSGLEAFGPGDEPARLRSVAGDPTFREAVTWQNRAARANAVDRLASTTNGSKRRQREELVASYWQRYCAKNDTIGFFGPLGWGRVVERGPALSLRAGAPDAHRNVHLETWALQALVDAHGVAIDVPLGPWPERDVRDLLGDHPEALVALDQLEAARDAVAAAAPDELDDALTALDETFEKLTAHAPTQRAGAMYAGRTVAYLDCTREMEMTVGPALLAELSVSLPVLMAGGRWYCGQVLAAAREMIAEAVAAAGGRGPAAPVVAALAARLLSEPPEVGAVVAGLQRRWAELLDDPDRSTLAERAERVFAGPRGWPLSVYHCPDVQVAARSVEAIDAGEFLCVVGDYHPGNNVLGQGLFANRHPDRARFLEQLRADAGAFPFVVPSRQAPRMSSRIMPAITRPEDLHVVGLPGAVAPLGCRAVSLADLVLEGTDLVSGDGTVRLALEEVLQLSMFVAGVRAYDPFPVDAHGERITVGRTVLRRETWNVSTDALPQQPMEVRAWADRLGLPRHVFALSPLEDKPVYVDLESEVLTRVLCRQVRHLTAERPGARMRFTEMLPAAEDCWFTDESGQRFTSELRLVAVDLGHRSGPERGCP